MSLEAVTGRGGGTLANTELGSAPGVHVVRKDEPEVECAKQPRPVIGWWSTRKVVL